MGLRFTRPSERRAAGERGAVLVELAFIAMFLVILVAGTFDYGFAWRTGLAVNEAARTGARVGSGQGISRGADYYALNGVRAALDSSGLTNDVRKVVIFKSTNANGGVPASCVAPSPSGSCNVLTGAQLNALTTTSYNLTISSDPAVAPTGTGCLKSSAATYVGWCPNARSNDQDAGSDYYGVYVEVYYRNKFRVMGDGVTIRRSAIMRLEPTGFGG
ncbi:MAG: TadE/TadG family type IV pilus assembly protein [Acidimicrobiales bacterium]